MSKIPMTAVKKLKKARALIVKGWTKDHAARDKYGHPRDFDSPKAVKFCALGAVWRVARGLQDPYLEAAVALVEGHTNVIVFNDVTWRKKEEVLEVYDIAIELARGEL